MLTNLSPSYKTWHFLVKELIIFSEIGRIEGAVIVCWVRGLKRRVNEKDSTQEMARNPTECRKYFPK